MSSLSRLSWRAKRLVWTLLCLTVLIVPVLGLALLHIGQALSDGLILGAWLLMAGFGVVEIFAPSAVLEWRAWMMEGGPAQMQRIGSSFDALILTGGPNATWRVRLIGVTLITLGSLLAIILFWALRTGGLA
jgi:hypothetical protein